MELKLYTQSDRDLLNMDKLLEALKTNRLSEENICFSEIRKIAGIDHDLWETLGRGRAVLASIEQLDQYLFSYGPMISSQWHAFAADIIDPVGQIQINDYGCGQGVASLLFREAFESASNVVNINLIEPSGVALERAEGVVACCYPKAKITKVNKYFDDMGENDIVLAPGTRKFHLFSQVLDIESFDSGRLFNKVLSTPGRHSIICVSHNRGFLGGGSRVKGIYDDIVASFEKRNDPDQLKSCDIREFGGQQGKSTIAFYIDLEI